VLPKSFFATLDSVGLWQCCSNSLAGKIFPPVSHYVSFELRTLGESEGDLNPSKPHSEKDHCTHLHFVSARDIFIVVCKEGGRIPLGGCFGSVPELFFQRKQLIPALQQLLVSYPKVIANSSSPAAVS